MHRLASVLLLIVGPACVRHAVISSVVPPPARTVEAPARTAPPTAGTAPVTGGGNSPGTGPAAPPPVAAAPEAPAGDGPAASPDDSSPAGDAPAEEDAREDEDAGGPSAEEGESHDAAPSREGEASRYTSELSDEELAERWRTAPATLGSLSIGFVDEGRLVNAEQFPAGDGWVVVSPERAWATKETIDFVIAAIQQVRAQDPAAPPLRVNQISAREGGYLRPHKSHQTGRDVDLAFYYPTAQPVQARERERYIDVARNWALLKALITSTDVQLILLDRRVQKVIHDYALKAGEDRAWLDSIFNAGLASLVQHARGHRDHFHVRFYNARAQELGRRVAPLLAQRPDQNLLMYRVRAGDTLGALARRYGSTVAALQKANHLKGSFLRLAQVLRIPLRGACTQCPVPPPVVVPARRLPPSMQAQRKADAPAGESAQDLPPGAPEPQATPAG